MGEHTDKLQRKKGTNRNSHPAIFRYKIYRHSDQSVAVKGSLVGGLVGHGVDNRNHNWAGAEQSSRRR